MGMQQVFKNTVQPVLGGPAAGLSISTHLRNRVKQSHEVAT